MIHPIVRAVRSADSCDMSSRTKSQRRALLALASLVTLAIGCRELSPHAYHVDCAAGSDAEDGLAPQKAWRTLARVNAHFLIPGDSVRFKRGTTCSGALRPLGLGSAEAPIVVGAYGSGPLPIIDAHGEEAALVLVDLSGFEIGELELTGGGSWGVLVVASAGTVRHVRLANLRVHDVFAGEISSKQTGLVVFAPGGPGGRFEDVVVDGVDAWNTDQWSGIHFYGALWDSGTELSRDVVIRNSTVHHVHGDGIVVFGARDAVIETSVAHHTGLQPKETIGTPNGIWTWWCDRCTVQYNEGYATHSPGVDGGVFDIDWATRSNVVQYNYGHDAQAYCVAVFGAEGWTTRDAVIRYNVCAHNGRGNSSTGDVHLLTWTGGALDGVAIYNNTFVWDPPVNRPVLVDAARYAGEEPRFFFNNVVHSETSWLVHTTLELDMDHNLYWVAGGGRPWFSRNEEHPYRYVERYDGLDAWRSATGQDARSLSADPKLAGDGSNGAGDYQISATSPAIDAGAPIAGASGCDFFGGELDDAAVDIGAHEFGARPGSSCES